MSGSSKRKKKNKNRAESSVECSPFDQSRTSKSPLEACRSIHSESSCISSVDDHPTEQHHSSSQAVQDSKLNVHSLNEIESGSISGHSEAISEALVPNEGASLKVTDKSKRKKKKSKLSIEKATEPHTNGLAPSSFEEELAWCINQLQLGIISSRGDKHQRQTYEKSIKTLSSTKTALPRKRQLMRSMFGDYRVKMKTHPVPECLLQSGGQPGITSVETKDTGFESKYIYYRPSASSTTSKRTTKDVTGSGNCKGLTSKTNVENGNGISLTEFRFNFKVGPELLT